MRKFWKTMNIVYERFILLVLVLVLLVVVYAMYDMYYVYERAGNNELLKYKPTASGYDAAASPITEDMVGWLTINSTDIDYPVMQTDNNTKYLNTDPYGNYSLSGSIYLDSRNAADFSDKYCIIYGHHMEYGKMFGALDKFVDANYLAEHKYGTLVVGRNAEKTYSLKIFAALVGNAKNERLFDPNKTNGLLNYIKANAAVFDEERQNRILVMSTCSEIDAGTRTMVFAYILE